MVQHGCTINYAPDNNHQITRLFSLTDSYIDQSQVAVTFMHGITKWYGLSLTYTRLVPVLLISWHCIVTCFDYSKSQ